MVTGQKQVENLQHRCFVVTGQEQVENLQFFLLLLKTIFYYHLLIIICFTIPIYDRTLGYLKVN